MNTDKTQNAQTAVANALVAGDVIEILQVNSWLSNEPSAGQRAWCERAVALLGPHADDREALAELLEIVFHYDASKILAQVESHVVLSRYGARDVVRQLALLLLEDGPLTTERFSEIVNALKERLDVRSRDLFHPLRLALAGRAGEGELDRAILLLDEAAVLGFAVPVKTARERILEFCASLD